MATWRVTVKADTAEKMELFKNEVTRFKQLYSHGGADAVFEIPLANEKGADAIVSEAEKIGFTAKKEKFEDPLDSIETSADFW